MINLGLVCIGLLLTYLAFAADRADKVLIFFGAFFILFAALTGFNGFSDFSDTNIVTSYTNETTMVTTATVEPVYDDSTNYFSVLLPILELLLGLWFLIKLAIARTDEEDRQKN